MKKTTIAIGAALLAAAFAPPALASTNRMAAAPLATQSATSDYTPNTAPLASRSSMIKIVPEPLFNEHSLSYFQAYGQAQASGMSGAYWRGASMPPAAGANPTQMEMLSPVIRDLRSHGIEDGKISLELSRRTPAQFVHWARQVSR